MLHGYTKSAHFDFLSCLDISQTPHWQKVQTLGYGHHFYSVMCIILYKAELGSHLILSSVCLSMTQSLPI